MCNTNERYSQMTLTQPPFCSLEQMEGDRENITLELIQYLTGFFIKLLGMYVYGVF